ncbi:TPA: relaxase/mobilization nuclease domain-containing protein [Streptococcus agalactiae]
MAVTKIKPIKSTLKKALEYIQNPDKTDDKMLVSSFGCSYETADIEFAFTLSQALDKGNNLAHHLIQSFEPGEVSFEKAHEIGKQLADAVTKGQYEYVLTTHIDKGHVHNHIIFCAVNFVDYHKYNSNKRSYYGIRNISDRLCYENGLSVITPEKGRKGKSYIEYQTAKIGTSWKGKLKEAVDLLIPQVTDFEKFLEKLQASGYEIKRGKYVSCRALGQERFTRLKTLGVDYTEEAIRKRIVGIRSHNVKTLKQEQGISLLIDIENNIKAQQSAGYEYWAKIHNLKQAAKTMNFLTENNILQYEDLIKKIDEIILDSEQMADSLKQAEKKLSDMAVLIKNISTYQKTKDIHRGYIKAKDKEAYRCKYESNLILYEASGKALKDAGIKKLPELAALQKEYSALQKHKEVLYSDYGKLKKKVKEYQKIKQNVDTILQRNSGKEHTKTLE